MSLDIEPHHAAHRHKSGNKWLDMTVALSALFISLVSLVIAVVHGRTMERMADANARLVAANSWPFIQYTTSNLDPQGNAVITMGVTNAGVGPAKVESVQLFWRGVPYPTSAAFVRACCGYTHKPYDGMQQSLLQGRVLRAGQDDAFVTVPKATIGEEGWVRLEAARTRAALQICYCSVFDECWIGNVASSALTPAKVDKCPAPRVFLDVR
jgi:hypothetical protein